MKKIIFIAGALTMGIFFIACNQGSKSSEETSVMDSSKMGDHAMPGMKGEKGDLIAPMNTMQASMNEMHMTADADYDFLNMMIAHHQAAIGMANIELSHGTDAALKTMAKSMVEAQQNEINAFESIKKNAVVPPDMLGSEAKTGMMESMNTMTTQMGEMKMTGNIDKDFALMMIPHHEGAVAVAKDQIALGKNSELKKMAQKIIDDQTKEIEDMKAWLAGK